MDKNNNLTLRASLDTSQLKKDLEKIKGEVKLKADTRDLTKQIESAVNDASCNSSVAIGCRLNGMDTVLQQIRAASSQLQGLGQAAASLGNNINLKVSVDTTGLQQYTAQLESLAQMSGKIQMPAIGTDASRIDASIPKSNISANSPDSIPASSFKEAESDAEKFSGTLDTLANLASLLTATLNAPDAFKSFTKNLD